MRPSNITLCLYASTKGHHGHTQIYRRTVDALLAQIPRESWGGMIAHVKWGVDNPADKAQEAETDRLNAMVEWLTSRGFRVIASHGIWSHFAESHQRGYMADVQRVLRAVTTPYVLHAEDDFVYVPYDRDLEYWLHHGVSLLDVDPTLMQVRIARFTNEFDRINGLRAKHGLDARAEARDDKWFAASDLSMNPSLFRARDLLAALVMLSHSSLPQHIEHGTSVALKLLSEAPLPFAVLNPDRIRVAHIGVAKAEDEDPVSAPFMAN